MRTFYTISADGISPDDRKLQLIREYPVPKNQKQLRSAMGLFNYYRRFCAGYSKKSDCLRRLLKQDTCFLWTEECDRAFQSLKDCSWSFRRRVLPVNHLYWYWQPNKNNQATEHTNNKKIFIYLLIYLFIMKSYTKYTIKIKGKVKY